MASGYGTTIKGAGQKRPATGNEPTIQSFEESDESAIQYA
jgi:hypothetical protein